MQEILKIVSELLDDTIPGFPGTNPCANRAPASRARSDRVIVGDRNIMYKNCVQGLYYRILH
jgi:hypothetical protein